MNATAVLLGLGLLVSSTALAGSAPAKRRAPEPAPTQLSFCQAPFVHPRVIEDLLSWESDGGKDQVIAINLLDVDDSNRYFGDIETNNDELRHRMTSRRTPRHPLVFTKFEDPSGDVGDKKYEEEDGYEYVGMTRSGVHVLLTYSSGNQTDVVLRYLLFVTIEKAHGLSPVEMPDEMRAPKTLRLRPDKPWLLARRLGEVYLGDRWDGEVRVEGNKVVVGPSPGRNTKEVVLDLEDSQVRPGILRPCP